MSIDVYNQLINSIYHIQVRIIMRKQNMVGSSPAVVTSV